MKRNKSKDRITIAKVLKRWRVATNLNDQRENNYRLIHEEIVETLEEVCK